LSIQKQKESSYCVTAFDFKNFFLVPIFTGESIKIFIRLVNIIVRLLYTWSVTKPLSKRGHILLWKNFLISKQKEHQINFLY